MPKQISQEQIDLLVERLVDRIDKTNTKFLKSIGSSIDEISKLTPTKAQQLAQMLKYGGKYDDLVRQLKKYTSLNEKDLDKIFQEYAKKDQAFYKDFYKYKDVPYVPFDQNTLLKNQTMALANISRQTMTNFTNANVVGYTINDKFYNLKDTYIKVLDEAVLNASTGKETFDSAMQSILKDIGGSGLKTIEFQSGRTMRMDSAIRMHLNNGLRELHMENQKIIGKEFDSDGVEISVHLNPAPDHALVQGRQFSNEEFDKFQNDQDATSYEGIFFPATSEETGHDRRSISEYNCYHYIFPIILGVSKPEYTNEQLQKIIDDNNKGFELDGKHYTNYEGTQLQRQLERKIREQKDIQILAKASDNKELIGESQRNITQLTNKYKELSKVSGLPTKMDRLKVSGYQRTKIEIETKYDGKFDNEFDYYKDKFASKNITIDDEFKFIDGDFASRNLWQLDKLTDKYPILKDKIKNDGLLVKLDYDEFAGDVNIVGNKMTLSKGLYQNKEKYISLIKEGQDDNWSSKVYQENYDIYTITHETGHVLEDAIIKERIKKSQGFDIDELAWNNDYYARKFQHQEDVDIFNEIFLPVSEQTGISWEELYRTYVSDYGRSQNWFEWFAEMFTKMELGEQNIMTKRFREYIEGELWKK